MKVEAFVVHLKRAGRRRRQVDRIIDASPVPTHVIDAVDGRELSHRERSAVHTTDALFQPPYPFAIGAGEIACFLSHRTAWQTILDRKLDAGLVFEDDVEIDANEFAPAFELARRNIGKHGVAMFQVRDIDRSGPVVDRMAATRLHRPDIVPLRSSCTLYAAEAASRLLQLTERFDRPVDGLLQLHWVTGIRPVIVVPSGVSDMSDSVGGTTIQFGKPGLAGRLAREISRLSYRWKIGRRSHGVRSNAWRARKTRR